MLKYIKGKSHKERVSSPFKKPTFNLAACQLSVIVCLKIIENPYAHMHAHKHTHKYTQAHTHTF